MAWRVVKNRCMHMYIKLIVSYGPQHQREEVYAVEGPSRITSIQVAT